MKLFTTTAAAVFAAGASFAMTAPAVAADKIWIEDNMPAAMEKAKAEGKDILIDFTGTDWCIWCIRLKDEVFNQSEFKETIPDKFVLVMLDFPRDKPQTDEVRAHNAEWQQKFEIRGYPTIVLADANGEEYARTGYREGGPTPYIEHLNELRAGKDKRDEALKAAASSEGIEKARHLDAAMSIEGIVVPNREDKMKQIIALDADNSAGLKAKYEKELKQLQLQSAFTEVENMFRARQVDEALAKLDEIEANFDLDTEDYMNLVGMRVSLLINSGNNEAAERAIASAMAKEGLDAEQRQMIAVNRINIVFQSNDNALIRRVAQEIIDIAPDTELSAQIQNFLAGLPSEDEG
jgi:thiol-disulfide isomerase/thioredoxin